MEASIEISTVVYGDEGIYTMVADEDGFQTRKNISLYVNPRSSELEEQSQRFSDRLIW